MRKIYISCGHNNARNSIVSLVRDQWASVMKEGILHSEFRYAKKICSEIVWDKYVFVPEGLNLNQRIKWINDRVVDGDMCIELHMDAASAQAEWCSTWYMSGSNYAKDRATTFQREYTRITGIKWRWVKWDLENRWGRLAFVRDTKCPAFLLEMGFITNDGDRDKVWKKAAQGIIFGLDLILIS